MPTTKRTNKDRLLTLLFVAIVLVGGGTGILWSTTNMGTPGATFIAAISKVALFVVVAWFVDTFLFSTFDTIHEVINEQNLALALWEGAIFVAFAIMLASA